jgi:hypothetical protein
MPTMVSQTYVRRLLMSLGVPRLTAISTFVVRNVKRKFESESGAWGSPFWAKGSGVNTFF